MSRSKLGPWTCIAITRSPLACALMESWITERWGFFSPALTQKNHTNISLSGLKNCLSSFAQHRQGKEQQLPPLCQHQRWAVLSSVPALYLVLVLVGPCDPPKLKSDCQWIINAFFAARLRCTLRQRWGACAFWFIFAGNEIHIFQVRTHS